MKKNTFFSSFLVGSLFLVLLVSCKKDMGELKDCNNHNSNEISNAGRNGETDLVKSVRTATARYHSTTLAMAAGYVTNDHCVAVPGVGGMGYHWANQNLVDPVFNPMQPEVMLYATGPGGNLRLVAVEYIVINVGQPRPMFGDHPFDIGGTPVPVAHWSLHLWAHENNPSGIFTPFNPTISCP